VSKQPEPKITLEDMDNAPGNPPVVAQADVGSELEILRRDFSRVSQEKAELELELDRLKRANRASEILDNLIEPFANKTFYFMCTYCAFVGLIVILNAFGCFSRQISDSVAQILVGSTAVTVIGLVGMVLTGIFVGARNKKT
jgi:hypothetical protein